MIWAQELENNSKPNQRKLGGRDEQIQKHKVTI